MSDVNLRPRYGGNPGTSVRELFASPPETGRATLRRRTAPKTRVRAG